MRQFVLIIILILPQWILSKEPVALISKLRGVVNNKMFSDDEYQSKTNLNTPIITESQIRTNDNSFTKVVYLDDGTSISMYPQTELIIRGTINNRFILKQIYLVNGILRVNVTQQKIGIFKLVTPYSELTCKECGFWIISDELNGDKFIKESGDSEVWNTSMNITAELVSDSTLISQLKVNFNKYKTPIADVKYIEFLMFEADEIPQQYKIEDHQTQESDTTLNIVVIKLKNAANLEREIILTYTQ